MNDSSLEIPIGKRRPFYRFFEILTPVLTFTVLILVVVLSVYDPFIGAVFILAQICLFFAKGLGIVYNIIIGRRAFMASMKVDWHQRLQDLVTGCAYYDDPSEFKFKEHLKFIAHYKKNKAVLPVEDVYHLVIMAAYNESYDVIDATIKSLCDTTYDKQRMIICLAYEQRGGQAIEATAKKLQKQYGAKFADFQIVQHPANLPNEVIGKGGNITYAGRQMGQYLKTKGIKSEQVVVTTLDSDNKPHPMYFDYVTYQYVIFSDRKQLSFQPVSLFLNNIWDAPAPARVIATGNSFWNMVCSTRPFTLRNFASHSQPLSALEEMDFWSTRTIVEDGHQYWRSFFHFKGDYYVVPIYLPIYQDAVRAESYLKTLRAQFLQLRRWSYGVSDVPYVASNVLKVKSKFLAKSLLQLFLLIESNISLGVSSIIIAFGGWIPLLFNSAAHSSLAAHQLPVTVSFIQQIAMVGMIITIAFSILLLPPRPNRYKKTKVVSMVLQWVLIPITSILFNSLTSLYSQYRLMSGRYLDKFDVTDKTLVKDK